MHNNFSIYFVKNSLKKRGTKTVVLVGGSFDILHIGHLRFLQNAKKMGGILVIALNSDKHIKSYKKVGKPIINDRQRAEMLVGFKCVDFVFLTNKGLYDPYIYKNIRPNILGVGKEKDRKVDRIKNFDVLHKMFPDLKLKFINKGAEHVRSTHIEQKSIITYTQ